jgi:hypothetical protein
MNRIQKFGLALGAAFASLVVTAQVAMAQAATPVDLAEDAGTSFRDTGIAVIAILIPLAVAFLLAKKALPWARRMLHV